MPISRRKPELMSPVGHWPQLHAAIEAGADAVYFGLTHFTARAKAGFTLAELPEALRTLHARGVRAFLTFNTLIFDHELDEAARALHEIIGCGVDALIMQDPAAILLARRIAPDVEIHASTQTSVTNADGAHWAQALGANRVNLARELSLDELRKIAAEVDVELETFVHGALCVAYSGQCFSSEAWGGRSANRGQCAQACRLPYDLMVDGRHQPLGDARYLLSPGDLFGIHQIPELIDIGVASVKIEGRYKDAEYVAATTRAYRKAIDEAWASRPVSITPAEELQLEQVYSRGLGPFFLAGTNHQKVVHGRAPRHRGVLAAKVVEVNRESVVVRPEARIAVAPLKPGDGVVFDAASWRSPGEPEEGGRLYEIAARPNGTCEVRFGRNAVDFTRIRVGDWVWRSSDPNLEKSLRPITHATAPVHRQPVKVTVEARVDELLKTTWALLSHPHSSVSIESETPCLEATAEPLNYELVERQLGRLGNTPYRLESLDVTITGRPFLAASTLNQLRRAAVEALSEFQSAAPELVLNNPVEALGSLQSPATPQAASLPPAIHLLVRTPEQLDAALDVRPDSITLDYLDLYGLKPSVERVRVSGIPVRVASPRVFKPGEEKLAEFLLRLDCPLLIRPAGLLHALQSRSPRHELTGDFSLNAANAISARWFLEQGLARLAPTHDLNARQIADLARFTDAARIEAIAYQHLPVFHTEHCVFCRFMSAGTSYKDCGRPCEKHSVELRDSSGRMHPVLADTGCRNTVFGAEAQEASAPMAAWLAAGIRHFRLEFAHETAAQVTTIAREFRKAMQSNDAAAFTRWRESLDRLSGQGTTQGSLFVPAGYDRLPILQ